MIISFPRKFASMPTISFCELRCERNSENKLEKANEVMKCFKPDCLSPENRERYVTLARQGSYNEVIGAIWRDKANRLAFCELLEGEYHVPIMFEQGIAMIIATPTEETAHKVVRLFEAAKVRMLQDFTSTRSPILARDLTTIDRMILVYSNTFKEKIEKTFGQGSIQNIMKAYSHIESIETHFLTSWLIQGIQLPPPDWTYDKFIRKDRAGTMVIFPDFTVQQVTPISERDQHRTEMAQKTHKETTTLIVGSLRLNSNNTN